MSAIKAVASRRENLIADMKELWPWLFKPDGSSDEIACAPYDAAVRRKGLEPVETVADDYCI